MTGQQQVTPLFRVVGEVAREYHYGLDKLLTMDRISADDLLIACGSGEPKRRASGFSGVLLTDIINKVEVIIHEHNDTKRMFVVISSDDGYRTVFSWQELFNSEVGSGVMVLLEKEGKSIPKECGCVDLLSARDFLIGPRYVKRLSTVTIVKLD